jgi:hypothetical protein
MYDVDIAGHALQVTYVPMQNTIDNVGKLLKPGWVAGEDMCPASS